MITLIISYYKNLPALSLIFEALKRQTFRDFEVVVAEDDNDPATLVYLVAAQQTFKFPIRHVCHEKIGFRKTKILNDAVRIAQSDKLVFIDGDSIPHSRFLSVYNKNIKEGGYYYGRRVWLSQSISERALATKNPKIFSLLNLYLSHSTYVSEGFFLPFRLSLNKKGREIWGCNWGVLKKYFLQVNGFDEDYTQACFGEDLDIGWRLRKIGLHLVSLKNKAIQYHLYHKMWYNDAIIAEGRIKFEDKKSAGQFFCANGITKI